MSNTPDLADLRLQMDAVNKQLTAVLHERARIARAIGAVKHKTGSATVDVAREAAMLAEMLHDSPPDGFDPRALETILEVVLQASRDIVAEASE